MTVASSAEVTPDKASSETDHSALSVSSKPKKSKSPSPRRDEKQASRHKRAQPVNVREVSPEEISTSGLHAPLMEKISVASQALMSAEKALMAQPGSVEEWESQLKV